MTLLRRTVPDMLRQAPHPLSACDLPPRLDSALGRRIAPPTVYRALDFLCRAGLAARIERQVVELEVRCAACDEA